MKKCNNILRKFNMKKNENTFTLKVNTQLHQ
jgi:hypothetical protein